MSNDLLQKAIHCLAISDVYLRDTRATLHKDFDPKIAGQQLDTMLRFGAERVDQIDAEQIAGAGEAKQAVKLVRIHLAVGLRFMSGGLGDDAQKNPDEISKQVKAEIVASYIAEYRVTCNDLDLDAIQEFAQRNAGYHVWPYWREYVQSVCSRMHLPAVIMPMFQLTPADTKKTDGESAGIQAVK